MTDEMQSGGWGASGTMAYTAKSKQVWKCIVEFSKRSRGITDVDDNLDSSCSQSTENSKFTMTLTHQNIESYKRYFLFL